MWIKTSIAAIAGAFLSLPLDSFAETNVQRIPVSVEIKENESKGVFAAFKFKNNQNKAICIASRYWSMDVKNFEIYNAEKFTVKYKGITREFDGPPRDYVIVPPGYTEEIYLNLSKYYDIEAIGRYYFSLTVFAPFCSSFDVGVADEPSPRTLAREPSLEAQLALLSQRQIKNGVLLASGEIDFEISP